MKYSKQKEGIIIELKDEKLLNNLIKIIKYNAKIFGGVSDYFYDKKEQDAVISLMINERKIPDYYYLEIKNLVQLHSLDLLSPEERIPIYDLFDEKSNLLVKKNEKICLNYKF